MKVVYPLGNGSPWNDMELKLSINSLLKNCNVTDIYIVGEIPRTQVNAVYLPFKSKYNSVAQNVADKILYFMDQINPEKFIIMNDDFFCNVKTNLNTLPVYYDKKISERVLTPGISSKYKYTLMTSIIDKDDLNFGLHFPLPVRHHEVMRDSLKYAINIPNGCSYRNIYGNRVKAFEKIEQKNDVKFSRHTKHPEEVLNYDWFSIGDEFLLPKNRAYLYSLFNDF
jgi:hypothetical protein